VVGTPGRLNDLLALANPPVTNLNACGYVVLDEADRMLDMGFAPQIDKIFQLLPSKRQTLFFTATWPREVQQLAKSYLSPNAMQVMTTNDL
jgi:ATP-dependent RNA helicase DDX5/DBP2